MQGFNPLCHSSHKFVLHSQFHRQNFGSLIPKLITKIRMQEKQSFVKGTYRENTPANTTQALTKSMNIDICSVGTLNQIFIRGFDTAVIKLDNEIMRLVTKKAWFFFISPFYTPHSNCLNIGFWSGSFVWKCCVFYRST